TSLVCDFACFGLPDLGFEIRSPHLDTMNSFRNHRLRDFSVPMSTNWLLNDLAEAKGKQELYTRQSPRVLKALREMALVQRVESSNRIEGVTVAANRLRPLVLGHARPKDRSEQEIAGYRNALNLVFPAKAEVRRPGGAIWGVRVLSRK